MAKIEISDNLIKILEKRASEKGFTNVEQYINMILDKVIEKLNMNATVTGANPNQEAIVKDRLRRLGYID